MNYNQEVLTQSYPFDIIKSFIVDYDLIVQLDLSLMKAGNFSLTELNKMHHAEKEMYLLEIRKINEKINKANNTK